MARKPGVVMSWQLVLTLAALARTVAALGSGDLFEYKSGNAQCLKANDDDSLPVPLSPDIVNVFGKPTSKLWVNNNGDITFDGSLSAYTPRFFPIKDTGRLIAPFWADVDTRGPGSGLACARISTDAGELNKAAADLGAAFPALARTPQGIKLSKILIATWDNVGYYEEETDKKNTFQAFIGWQSNITFTCFYYPEGGLQWVTGAASGGKNGFDGTAAKAGFNAGDGVKYFNLPGSGSNTIVTRLSSESNMGVPGKWCFRLDQEGVVPQVPRNLTLAAPGGSNFSEGAIIAPRNTSIRLSAGAVSSNVSCGGLEYQWDLNYQPSSAAFSVDTTGPSVNLDSQEGVRTVGVRASDLCGTSAVATTVVVLNAQSLLTNGGFETPVIQPPSSVFPTGSAISGWAVSSGSVVVESAVLTGPAEGQQSVSLNGGAAQGGLSQRFDTRVGCTYVLSFALAGNPDCLPAVKTVEVAARGGATNGTRATFTFNTQGQNKTTLRYERHSMNLVAASDRTTISFTSVTSAAASCGPIIDDVAAYESQTCDFGQLGPTAPEYAAGALAIFGGVLLPILRIVPSADDAERPSLASSPTVLVTLDFGVAVRSLDRGLLELENAAIVSLDPGASGSTFNLVLNIDPPTATGSIRALGGAATTTAGTPTLESNEVHVTAYERNDGYIASIRTLTGVYTASLAGSLAVNVLMPGLAATAGSTLSSFAHAAFLAGTTNLAAPYHPIYYQAVQQLQYFVFNTPIPAIDKKIWPMETPINASANNASAADAASPGRDYIYEKVHGPSSLIWRRITRLSFWFLIALLATVLLHWAASQLLEERKKEVFKWLLFPRPELAICILALTATAMTAALALHESGAGVFLVGVLLAILAVSLVAFCVLWVAAHVLQLQSVRYALRCDVEETRRNSKSSVAKRMWYRLLGQKFTADWVPILQDQQRHLVGKWGLLFEDFKGPIISDPGESIPKDELYPPLEVSAPKMQKQEPVEDEEDLWVAPVLEPPKDTPPTTTPKTNGKAGAPTKAAVDNSLYPSIIRFGAKSIRRYHFRLFYGPLDLFSRLLSGFLLGAFGSSDSSAAQVVLLFLLNVFMLIYLLALRPMALSRDQLVETVSRMSDVALLFFALILVGIGNPADHSTSKVLSIAMLAAFLFCMAVHAATYLYYIVTEAQKLPPRLRQAFSKKRQATPNTKAVLPPQV